MAGRTHFSYGMASKSHLVTGANGFIGQHLCRSLLDDRLPVRGLRHEPKPLYFVEGGELSWHDGDLAEPASLRGVADGVDTVFHLGAIPRNDLSKTWNEFEATNIDGTRSLLQECARSGIRRFVFASTVEAAGYGDGVHPRREEDPPHPDNNYGKSKLAAERVVMDEEWPFERTVIRLPMIYGPGTFLIVPKLFGMVKRGFYPLIGRGDTRMEFCYVANAVHGLRLAAEHEAAAGGMFYVSDERSYTIREVVQAIAEAMETKVRIIRIPVWFAWAMALGCEITAELLPIPPIVSRYSRKPFFTRETVWWTTRDVNMVSTEKIRSLLAFAPSTRLLQGCHETACWLRSLESEASRD